MQRTIVVSLAVLIPLAVVVFVTGVLVTNVRDSQHIVTSEFGFNWIIRIWGVYVAAIAALALLVSGLVGCTTERTLGLVVALFAGLLVSQVHWSTAIALAAISLAGIFFVTWVLGGYAVCIFVQIAEQTGCSECS